MENTLLAIALILITTKLGGIVSRKLKMPEVLGALVAGIIIGPLVLSVVKYDENIELLSNLGVILLMFLAGIETDAEQFKKAGKSSLVIAILGITVPLVLGTVGAFFFYGDLFQNIFIGVVLTATSVSITVETLTEMGKLNTRVGINILGAAVIDDILGLVLISVMLAVKNDGGGSSMIIIVGGMAAFCLVAVLSIMFLPKAINKLTNKIQPGITVLTLALAGVMIVALIAEKVGIAAITGAYLFGLLLSQISHKKNIEHNLKSISSGFLSPIFFASVGLSANMTGLSTRVLAITLVMFIVAVLGKLVGCGFAARLFKMSRSESV